MLYDFMMLTTYLLDLFIKMTFLDGIFGKSKRRFPLIPYLLILTVAEILPHINGLFTIPAFSDASFPAPATVIAHIASMLLFMLLTLLYDATWSMQIFTAVFFFLLLFIKERLFTLLVQCINPELLEIPNRYLFVYTDFGSILILFLLTLIVITFWKMREHNPEPLSYNILLFMVPLFTLMILVSMPLKSILITGNQTSNTSFFCLLFGAVTILNITNYLLIEKIRNINELKSNYQNMEQQMKFQREKYVQLGSYYKSMRSILHDMKNHYFAIEKYIEKEEYNKLQDYMEDAIQKMESCYAGVNTGNLVIDAFLNHFKMLSETEHITFCEDVSIIPDKVPLSDYDLCVVIGNLMDNAYNAVSKVSDREKLVNIHISMNDSDSFIIFVKNTYDSNAAMQNADDYEHGYGLSNIEKIVTNYHGVMQYKTDDYFAVTIVIPIIDNC